MVASLKERAVFEQDEKLTTLINPASRFDFGEFFQGHTRASGWFADRFGNVRRHFCGEFYGYYEGSDFVLDEKLFYTDGVIEERLWRVNVDEHGNFSASSDSLIGDAKGRIRGNTLSMRYMMRVMIEQDKFWNLEMRDTMILQPDGILHNTNHVYKWGIRIGTVSAQYLHQDDEQFQIPSSSRILRPLNVQKPKAGRSNVTTIVR